MNNKPDICVVVKNVYGRNLFYPGCEVSGKIADISGVKSFTLKQIESLKEVFNIVIMMNNNFHDLNSK
jgi:hypothetical protein